jgi:restriction system protein
MADRQPTNVSAAFDILLEAIEEEIGFATSAISTAAEQQDFSKVREHTERAERMTTHRSRLGQLRDEWDAAFGAAAALDSGDEDTERARRDLGRLKRGLRMRDVAFEPVILQVLAEMGGSGATADVVDRVGERMKDRLTEVDYERLPSSPHDLRWRNTAQWARFQLVQRGLLKDDSRRGTWELSEAGFHEVERLQRERDASA